MHSKFLSVMLMALVFVVACAAVPVKAPTSVKYGEPITFANGGNYTTVSDRISVRAMGCKTNGNTKVCTNTNRRTLVLYEDFDDVNQHFSNGLPDWKKTNSYEFCFRGACGAMTTLSGSQFTPKNYQHVAHEAQERFRESLACTDNRDLLYPAAVDVYLYEKNFVISWWFNYANYWPCHMIGTK
ncbi:hypothetical protein HPULCUR_006313 [Helicostylum pulchrum]|uniref:Uncharacterized protein n=1 Tax=Helicostylum pulchrum TaxID=562976 RepID=A0ABP9Y1L5_9FUNG